MPNKSFNTHDDAGKTIPIWKETMEIISTLFIDGWIYLVFFCWLYIMTLLESSQYFGLYRKQLYFISTWLMILFIGSRWCTGTDWNSYKELFDTLELNWTFLLNIYHFDIGYVLFNGIVKLFTNNYTIFLIINSFITIFVLYKLLIKISPYPNLSLLVFYSSYMITQFMGSNRRMMAIVFILWAFYFLYERKKLAFSLMISLAFLFHRSSIICLAVLFIPRNIFTIRKTVVLLSISLFIGLLQIPAKIVDLVGNLFYGIINHPIIEKMVIYSEGNDDYIVTSTGSIVTSTILAVAKRLLLLLFYFYIIRRVKHLDKLTQYIYNIYIIGFSSYLFFVGSFFQMLSVFFSFIEIILVSRMYSYSTAKEKNIIILIILLYGFFQIINALNVYPELYMPYIPFWSGIERIQF